MTQKRWPLVMSYVTAALIAVGSVQYANFVDNQSNERWCQLLTVLDGAYKETPPQTTVGKNVASEISKLVREFECNG